MSSSTTTAPASSNVTTSDDGQNTTTVIDTVSVTTTTTITPSANAQTSTPAPTDTTASNVPDVTENPTTIDTAVTDTASEDTTPVTDQNVVAAVDQPAATTSTSGAADPSTLSVTPVSEPTTITPVTDAPTVIATGIVDASATVPDPVAPTAVPTPITSAAPALVPVPSVGSTVNETIASSLTKVGPAGQIVLSQINDYMNNMHPKRVLSIEEGSRNQASFYKTLMRAINVLDEDFNEVFSTILKVFHEEKDSVFADTHVFRFFDNVHLSSADRQLFQRILNLLKTTADPKGRVLATRQVDINATVSNGGFNERARQRVLAFFNIL
jgi:hypothetical protein